MSTNNEKIRKALEQINEASATLRKEISKKGPHNRSGHENLEQLNPNNMARGGRRKSRRTRKHRKQRKHRSTRHR
jgi:hypothetical protein